MFDRPQHSIHLPITRHENIIRQAVYVKRNIEAHSWNHCCSENAMSITQPECVFVALGIQHVMHMHHFVICGLPRSTVFLHIIS